MSSDHEELADAQEELVDRMDQESERVGGVTDDARDKLDQANSEDLIPEGLGREDPAYDEVDEAEDEKADAEGDD